MRLPRLALQRVLLPLVVRVTVLRFMRVDSVSLNVTIIVVSIIYTRTKTK